MTDDDTKDDVVAELLNIARQADTYIERHATPEERAQIVEAFLAMLARLEGKS